MKRENKGRMSFNKDKIRIIRGLDLLVIDEVSMVRADLLDAVDEVLRRYRDRTRPFGGVQLLLIGDLQQLPPVVVEHERPVIEANYRSPYFFDSHALEQLDYVTIELTKVYRQSDSGFLSLLNAVRENKADADVLRRLNERYIAGFNPDDSEGYVRLTTHNHLASHLNLSRLAALPGKPHEFEAKVSGNFPPSSYPADLKLTLKEGAQVMFIKNDTGIDRKYYNGMMGKVTAIDEYGLSVTPDDGSDPINVEPVEWENTKYVVNEDSHEISQKVDGVFCQLPLKLAWSITIHKSQGLTFDRAIIDASASFSHGQTYVALSRCRTLEGMVLEKPLTPDAIINDTTVNTFMQQQGSNSLDDSKVESMADAYRLHLASGLFNFRTIFNALEGVSRIYNENFIRIYPTRVQEFSINIGRMKEELIAVGDRFAMQLSQFQQSGQEKKMCSRIKDASRYFLDKLNQLLAWTHDMPSDHDNRNVALKLKERLELFEGSASIRRTLLEAFCEEDFNVDRYLDLKAEGAFSNTKKPKRTRKEMAPSEYSADNVNPALFDLLKAWRKEKSEELGVPAYTIANSRTLLAISNHMPLTFDDLGLMPGVGPATISRFGDDMLDIVDTYRSSAPDAKTLPMPKPKVKKPKGASARESYDMWLDGKTMTEIAKERGLSPGTIESHIVTFLDPDDENTLCRLVNKDVIDVVKKYYATHDVQDRSLTEIHDEIMQMLGGKEPGYIALKLFRPSK